MSVDTRKKGGSCCISMKYRLTLTGKLDNLNDYITACRTNHYKGAKLKSHNEQHVKYAIYEQIGRLRIEKPVYMIYRWYEPDR